MDMQGYEVELCRYCAATLSRKRREGRNALILAECDECKKLQGSGRLAPRTRRSLLAKAAQEAQ